MNMDGVLKQGKVLLTGATGYIGKALLASLASKAYLVVAPVRTPPVSLPENVEMPRLKDISMWPDDCNWFAGCDVVIHLAAKAHLQGESVAEYNRVNRDATLNLARMANAMGVKRFIFLSSIGVNGQTSIKPFDVSDRPLPVEDAAVSKFEAETGLRQIALESGMEVVIIRAPLVYGPNAPGNFGKLLTLTQKNLPLPLGAIHNKRSLVALDNLVDFIITCITHPKAANQTFLVSDDNDISTTELLQMMSNAAGKIPRLFSVPVSWLRLAAKFTGKQVVIDRLCGDLQVDISHTKRTLGWKPPITVLDGIRRCFEK